MRTESVATILGFLGILVAGLIDFVEAARFGRQLTAGAEGFERNVNITLSEGNSSAPTPSNLTQGIPEVNATKGPTSTPTKKPSRYSPGGGPSGFPVLFMPILSLFLVISAFRMLFIHTRVRRLPAIENRRGDGQHEKVSKDVLVSYTSAFRWDAPNDIAGDEKICSVCLEGFRSGESCRRLPCGHVFHSDCIEQWFSRSSECCLCKQDVLQMHSNSTNPTVENPRAPA